VILFNNLGHGTWYQDVIYTNTNSCDRSGFKALPHELILERHSGMYVLPEFAEPEHPADNYRAIVEKIKKGSIRPEPVSDDATFIVNEVTADSL